MTMELCSTITLRLKKVFGRSQTDTWNLNLSATMRRCRQCRRRLGAVSVLNSVWTQVRDANKLMGEGKAEEALAIYDDILTRRPTAYALHANRGAALDVLGRFEEALAALDKAIELKPSYPEAHHNRGVLLTKMGKYEEAMASHVKAAEGRPNFLEAVRGACDAATRAEKWEEAAAFATQALDINSESVEAHLDRAFVRFKQKQYEGAVEDYKFAYDSGRTDAATKHAYATVLSQLGAQQHGAGDGAGAVASFKKAVAIEPTEGRCFNLGMALTTVGSKEEGLAAYLQATSLNASNFQAWYMVGVLGIQLEQWDTAHQGFTKAAAVKVGNEPWCLVRGLWCSRPVVRCCCQPGEVECLYNAGFALTKLARNDEARSCFQAALKVDSTYAPARNALAALGAPKPKGPKPPAPPPKTVPQEALPSSSPPQAAPADGADTVPDAAAAPTSGGGADTSSAAAAATTDSAATAATAPAATAKTEPATATTESATAAPTTASAPAPASAAPPSPPAVSGSSSATTASAPTSSSASTTAPASASPAPTATATTATAEPVRRQSKKFRKPKPKAAKSSKPAKVYEVFPYAELKGLSSLPPGVDKKNLEVWGAVSSFVAVVCNHDVCFCRNTYQTKSLRL